jgi:glycine/D-amino acid oxidase-like deaminating enzyme
MKRDVILFGSGVAGLWIAARLRAQGYHPIVIEQGFLGGTQTLASQGMIHGGQKYAILGPATGHAASISAMPERWEEAFQGRGEIDLSEVRFASERQYIWAAGSIVSNAAVHAAASLVHAKTREVPREDLPPALAEMRVDGRFGGTAYVLPEKVIEVKSLLRALAKKVEGRVFKGTLEALSPEGKAVVSGVPLEAKAIVFSGGEGNESALAFLGETGKRAQRRPLRQIMVKTLPHPLYGHGIVAHPKPRVTITSAPAEGGGHIWYLGGHIAEKGAQMQEEEAIAFASDEMAQMFPRVDWKTKEWASLLIDRAEPFDEKGHLPPGPYLSHYGKVTVAWPVKLTFAPLLGDHIQQHLQERGILPEGEAPPLPPLPLAKLGEYPWDAAAWRKIP